jgi:hypothetical protein
MPSSENVLSVASKRRFNPTSLWISLTLDWKLLNVLRKLNKLSLLKHTKLPLLLALSLLTLPLLPLPSRLIN